MIRITEKELYSIINESVNNILEEVTPLNRVSNYLYKFGKDFGRAYKKAMRAEMDRYNNRTSTNPYDTPPPIPQEYMQDNQQQQTNQQQQQNQQANTQQQASQDQTAINNEIQKLKQIAAQNGPQTSLGQAFTHLANFEAAIKPLIPTLKSKGINTKQISSNITQLSNIIYNAVDKGMQYENRRRLNKRLIK